MKLYTQNSYIYIIHIHIIYTYIYRYYIYETKPKTAKTKIYQDFRKQKIKIIRN